jgi:molybdopterin/thiamine biosynthesis adenylyltransferase
VLDGCDNFATRLAVSDACVALGLPLTSAAVGRFQGQVANFAGHLPGQPCYRCYVGDAFDAQDCDTCAADGVLGALWGWWARWRR